LQEYEGKYIKVKYIERYKTLLGGAIQNILSLM
jgi:hypothetical protein